MARNEGNVIIGNVEAVLEDFSKKWGVRLYSYHPRAAADRLAVRFSSLSMSRVMDIITTFIGYGWVPDTISARNSKVLITFNQMVEKE